MKALPYRNMKIIADPFIENPEEIVHHSGREGDPDG
jgi:hypothetical protein